MPDDSQRRTAPLEKAAIFRGLDADALNQILDQMEPHHFEASEFICREGEPGKSLFVVQKGLLEVLLRRPEGVISVALLREGDIIGELSVLVNEPRSADVVARTPTDILELKEARYEGLLSRHPQISVNLNQVLVQRLRQSTLRLAQERLHREKAVILVSDESTAGLAVCIVEAIRAATVRDVGVILCRPMVAGSADIELPDVEATLAGLDRLAKSHSLIVTVARADEPNLHLLLDNVDRCLVVATPAVAPALSQALRGCRTLIEICLTSQAEPDTGGLPVVRTLDSATQAADIAWLGRHIARTKLGLALGAGGARGYAHVGVLEVLEEEGFEIDYVGGSSIGALVGYFISCRMHAAQIDSALRDIFSPHNVKEMLRTSMDGSSVGLEHVLQDLKKWTHGHSFADLANPLVMMTADLHAKKPVAISDGPIYEAVYAAMAVPGLVPPYERGSELLVDALTLVPVPVAGVRDAGADTTVAVNLMSRDTLESWPDDIQVAKPRRRRRMRMIDTLMESFDMRQLDTSVRNAAEADVVVTPRFGPSTWRDYHLADRFYAAGREMAREQLPKLRRLATPYRG
jgi:predicted acylesterase/phospholipase RssA/CRP-like cAMP-binding protein